ncbi:hypothetical protein U1Q18_042675 [Sarracenia purpurea var. burkii]
MEKVDVKDRRKKLGRYILMDISPNALGFRSELHQETIVVNMRCQRGEDFSRAPLSLLPPPWFVRVDILVNAIVEVEVVPGIPAAEASHTSFSSATVAFRIPTVLWRARSAFDGPPFFFLFRRGLTLSSNF